MDENRDEYADFVEERRDSYTDEIEPWGSVEVEPLPGVSLYATAGGWKWEARGDSRKDALRRLETRMRHLNPFEATDTDWGPPGEATGDPLAKVIPAQTRKRMRDYQSIIDPNVLPDESRT